MGSLERSKKKVQLWKKAIVHFSLCFIMGFFTGFAPTGKSSIFSNEVAISNKPLEFSPPPVEVLNPEKTQNFTTRELEETAISTAPEESRDAGNLKNPKEETINNGELNPRRLVIIVTPTSKTDRLRGVLLRRLANTLKLVAQPPPFGNSSVSMALRTAMRYVSRRLSSNGRVLSEEEKAAENVYIKKKEQEKLEKLAREGPKQEKTPATGSGGSGSVSDAKQSGQTSSTPKVSTDNYRNYAVVAGIATALAAFGWYYGSKKKESDQVQD
ncbi:probable beta-1,4-xylosyltransferase IRX9 [Olea europaea subsp. europaea]|uniref:Probable beta-1,4-xylosyltransferase IRX9 n=2 Tax=Olea europaea subsp. europaea TaxID=158383 RepID=A0A8S0T414_OLEEU|nr:probable beta-1,4-xylosyltransferase IRX9 [Olea europaea subsp. europaea]